jgi:hypothetical protein
MRLLVVELFGDIRQTNVFIAYAFGHDAAIEGNAGGPAAKFMHLEGGCRLLVYVESLTVLAGREEDVILDPGIHSLREGGIELCAPSRSRAGRSRHPRTSFPAIAWRRARLFARRCSRELHR